MTVFISSQIDVSTRPHIIAMMTSDNSDTTTDMSENHAPSLNVVL